MTHLSTGALGAILAVTLGNPARAELLVHEPFDYATGSVTGQATGVGWAGGWTQDGEPCVVSSEPLGYLDDQNNVLEVSGQALDTSGSATTRSFREISDAPLTEGWISFLYRLPSSNSNFEGVNFYLGSTSMFAVSNASTTGGAGITLNNFPQNTSASAGKGTFGQTHFIVLHLIPDASGGNDRVELFVDPPLTGPATGPDAMVESPGFSFDRVRVAAQNGSSLLVDELRLGDSFADVAPFDTLDSDGDGLTDEQELEVGLNPSLSDAALIQAIRENPEFFDLYDVEGIRSLTGGGVVIEGSQGEAEVVLEIQQSSDLSRWSLHETLHRKIALPSAKNFLRLRLLSAAP